MFFKEFSIFIKLSLIENIANIIFMVNINSPKARPIKTIHNNVNIIIPPKK